MRIIAGKAKGKKILTPIDKKTRPLKDIVKESIFNILKHSNLLKSKIDQCIILDLFSGVGSFGLEAISRGAKKVIFFENYKPTIELLIKNINSLKFNKQTEINKNNIYEDSYFKKLNYKFDLVFLDPPFDLIDYKMLIRAIFQNNVLNEDGKIFLESSRHTSIELSKTQNILKDKTIGDVRLIILQ